MDQINEAGDVPKGIRTGKLYPLSAAVGRGWGEESVVNFGGVYAAKINHRQNSSEAKDIQSSVV
jgi:hypothetical protein